MPAQIPQSKVTFIYIYFLTEMLATMSERTIYVPGLANYEGLESILQLFF